MRIRRVFAYTIAWVSVPYVFLSVRDALGSDGEGPFDGKLEIEFHGVMITSDSGLLAFRELVEAVCLTEEASSILSDYRQGKNHQHRMLATLRRGVYWRSRVAQEIFVIHDGICDVNLDQVGRSDRTPLEVRSMASVR